ncbi:MAG TPA: chemotaxis protein CheX [Phycisphaerales bacterium]
MDAQYIKPFIASIQNVFTTMMQLPVTVQAPKVKDNPSMTYDVSGIIGLSGDVVGSIVLSFPKETAERIVSLLTGSPMTADSPDFADAIGELVNMVSGGAKANFTGKKVSISCPSVVVGTGHKVAKQTDAPTIIIPCATDCGEVAIEVTIQTADAAVKAKAA